MKVHYLAGLFLLLASTSLAQNVGIGTSSFTPASDALLEMRSTNSGFLMPRMTDAQKNAISNPSEGLMIYQTNLTKGFQYYDGSSWSTFGGGSADNLGSHVASSNIQLSDNWLSNDGGNEGIRIADDGNVGIGTASPSQMLEVELNNNGLNIPVFLHNRNGTNGNNGIGVGFNSEQNGNWIKAALFHERTAGFGVGKMHVLLSDAANNNSVELSDAKLTIQPNGNVGIGVTSPNAQMDVDGDIIARGGDIYENAGTLRVSGEDNVFITMDYNNNDNNTRSIRFGKNGMASPTELMRIEEGGNVGIGTSIPGAKLHVQGDMRVTDLAGSGTRMVVVDGSGDLATQTLPTSGSTPTTVQSASTQNINSASYNNGAVSGMSISGLAAGDYLVNFNADITRNGSSSCQCVVSAGGTYDYDTERTFQIPSSGDSQFHLMGKVTLSSSGTIQIRCKKIPGGSGIRIKNRLMSVQATN